MKKKIMIILAAVLAVLILGGIAIVAVFSGSAQKADQNEFEEKLLGKWAYIHDPDTMVVSFRANGEAKFEGKKYSFSSDGKSILFTDDNGESFKLRYNQGPDQIDLYIRSEYVPMAGYPSNGIIGVWICPEKNWTFEFTDKGTFMEDGVLTGYYFVDEENGTIKLVYEEVLDDTDFYFQLNGEVLTVEYPWPMVKMK